MIRWIRTLGAVIARHLPTTFSLVFLAAIGVWGARNDWQAPRAAAFFQKAMAADEIRGEERPRTIEVEGDPAPEFVVGLGWAAAFPHGHRRIAFPSEDAVRKAGLRWVPAEERLVTEHVLANGMIDYDPTTYAHLATRAPGTIWRVEKQIGEPVRRGEVLALVESADVGKVKSDFLTSLNQYDLRSRLLQRMQEAGASVAERIIRESQASVHEARIRMFADQQALLNFGLVVRVDELLKQSDEQRVRELRLLGLPAALRTGATADTLTANLLPVAAPFDGQIVQRNAASGEAVTSARPLFVVADLRQVHLEMAVDPADVGKLRVGQSVVFMPQVGDLTPATGKLAHIGPEVDEKTRKVWVHAEADNPDGRLRPHTFGTGRIVVREEPRAVVVPADAVQSDGVHRVVFVRASAETVFQVRHVRTGLRSGSRIEVSGVRPGEEVVTDGSHALLGEVRKDRLAEAD
jgi:cobalt-zinc-cadmium efflux system membrane fusion protein